MAAAAVMRGEMTKEDLVFKQTGDSIVGTNYIRPSAAQKVTGTWDFGADDALKMPSGTLRLALTQAKVSHANILSIDTTEAESMPSHRMQRRSIPALRTHFLRQTVSRVLILTGTAFRIHSRLR